jgi:sialidase-1
MALWQSNGSTLEPRPATTMTIDPRPSLLDRLHAAVALVPASLPSALPTPHAFELEPAHASNVAPPVETGFESADPGPFERLATEIGPFSVSRGSASINTEHTHRGGRSLHLAGGGPSIVEFVPDPDLGPLAELTFWAERWTARDPFELRVEGLRDRRWVELHAADDEVLVGDFLARVRVVLDAPVERLRWVCRSPAGVLIDDVRLGLAQPMEVTPTAARRPALPCLLGRDDSPLFEATVQARGVLEPRRLLGARLSIGDAAGCTGVRLRSGAAVGPPTKPEQGHLVRFAEPLALSDGANRIELLGEFPADADLDARPAFALDALLFSDGSELSLGAPSGRQRMGLVLRNADADGVAVHRIPAITTTTAGTLIAAYDLRHGGWNDLPGDIDVAISRSTDGGRSFEPPRVAIDMGSDPRWRHDGVGDPAILVDPSNGRIWIAALWSHGDRGWHGSGPGLTPEETGQLVLVHSDDDGLTWSRPRSITSEVKDPGWSLLLAGPGRGIALQDGTLVFAAQYRDGLDSDRVPYATILHSRDHGQTWHLGAGARPHTTEAQVIELSDGVLMLNMRDDRGGSRAVALTRDLGLTWETHPSSRGALVEPVCNAGLLVVDEHLLVFSNPAVESPPRRRMTLKASFDGGHSWRTDPSLLLDEGQSAGYSSLTRIGEGHLGVLYECSRAQLVFQRIAIGDLRALEAGDQAPTPP